MKLEDRIKTQEKVDKLKEKQNRTFDEQNFIIRKDGIIREVKDEEE